MGQIAELDLQRGVSKAPVKVLVVDDEQDIVEEVVEQLEDEGMVCAGAFSATQALEQIKEDPTIGIVVTDIRMPGMDGLEMTRYLNDKYAKARDLCVIVVTGHAGMKEAIEALQLGAEDFLTKPISPDHLLHTVRRSEKIVRLRARDRIYQQILEREVEEKTAEIRDLAEDLAKQNDELVIINRLKEEFLQMMSHELNTPLNAIIGFSQLLRDSSLQRNDEKDEKCAAHIYSAGLRLMKTIDSILTMSTLSAGNLKLDFTRFSAQSFIDSIESDFVSALAVWNTTLTCHYPEQSIDMNADYPELHRAVGQLIENSAKFGKQDGQVSLKILAEGDSVQFIVADDGPGMSNEDVRAAMEPMRQLDGSSGRMFEGIGLGLPLVRGIARLHGGDLLIDSIPGEGTTATLSVPRDKVEKAADTTKN